MNATLQRKFSKAKAAGNHVVWSASQVMPVPFTMTGLVSKDSFAFLRVQGNAMVCTGINAHFRVPAGDHNVKISLALATAQNVVIPQTRMDLDGVTFGGDRDFYPAVAMPSGSLWKIVVDSVIGDVEYLPQDLTVTYQLRYANGPARSSSFSTTERPVGIGFFDVNGNFIVQ